ncbi:MAG: ankyrin repeat domain-containing protein [bacterium]|nr:ankyrin repeat domain-containing protein [bacterium]
MLKHFIATIIILTLLAIPLFAAEIHDAVQGGDLKVVKTLLKQDKTLLNVKDQAGNTPLHLAAQNGHFKLVKYLVAQGADLEAGDNEHTTPLQVAAYTGKLDVVKYLVSQGAKVLPADDHGMTALHWAAFHGHIEVADYLIRNGADMNARTKVGGTLLLGASLYGHPEMVKYLIAQKVDLEAVNNQGQTALMLAISRGQKEVTEILVENGAKINFQDNNQDSPLTIAIWRNNRDLIDFLISKGAEVNPTAADAEAPLTIASMRGPIEIVRLLLDKGADVNRLSVSKDTPLMFSVWGGKVDIAELLINRGAKVNIQNNDGITPLLQAVRSGNAAFVALLLKNGADARLAESHYNWTPLHIAALKGHDDVATQLFFKGAAVNAVDKEGRTPLYLAEKYGNKSLADMLRANGAQAQGPMATEGKKASLTDPLQEGEAQLWYLGHCGYGIRTKNHFLIFDYFTGGRGPTEPSLANGFINPDELTGLNVDVFATHWHSDHFDSTIFTWDEPLKNLTYVFGFQPEQVPADQRAGYNGEQYEYVAPRSHKVVDSMDITAIQANDAGAGFLVKVDGVSIYHAGDHAGWLPNQRDGYLQEIDFLSQQTQGVDFALVNVTGCHMQDREALYEGNRYTIDKLSPRVLIPTHGMGSEYVYKEFADRLAGDNVKIKVFTPENRGDSFQFRNGEMVMTD